MRCSHIVVLLPAHSLSPCPFLALGTSHPHFEAEKYPSRSPTARSLVLTPLRLERRQTLPSLIVYLIGLAQPSFGSDILNFGYIVEDFIEGNSAACILIPYGPYTKKTMDWCLDRKTWGKSCRVKGREEGVQV